MDTDIGKITEASLIELPDEKWNAYARSAYLAYSRATDFKNYQGLPMPIFDDLPPTIKAAWVAATQQVAKCFNIQWSKE